MSTRASLSSRLTLLIAVVLLLGPLAGSADDRDLFRERGADPYVFVMFDVSGSMHSSVSSSAENDDTLGGQDSPNSRLYQLKSTLHTILSDPGTDGIKLGFARFNQENTRVYFKHWLYTRAEDQADPAWWSSGLQFPAVGEQVWFGQNANNTTLSNDYTEGSCGSPLSLEDFYDFPKLGPNGTTDTELWVTVSNQRFLVDFSALPSGELGNYRIEVTVRVRRYIDCSPLTVGNSGADDWTETVAFEPYFVQSAEDLSDFRGGSGQLAFDFIQRDGFSGAGFNRWRNMNGIQVNAVCPSGDRCQDSTTRQCWDPNGNTSTGFDEVSPDTFFYPTQDDPLTRACTGEALDRGDVLPWDWVDHPQDPANPAPGFELSTSDEILCRLAPNTCVEGEHSFVTQEDKDDGLYTYLEVGDEIPDFRVARYFADTATGSPPRLQLQSQFEDYPPIMADGSTPLAGMLDDLGDWHDDWVGCAEDESTGDSNLYCRQRFVLLLTDGIETCAGDPAAAAADLYNSTRADIDGDGTPDGPGIRTFVVGFGAFVGGAGASQLEDIARAGGTGKRADPGDGMSDVDGNGIEDCEQFSSDNLDLCASNGIIQVSTKAAAVDALTELFGNLRSSPASFASAAVPIAQGTSTDSIFLADFVPLDQQEYYAGRVSHFVRPLPLRDDGNGRLVPDRTRTCPSSGTAVNCLAWEADSAMRGVNGTFDQVPSPADVATDLQLGNGTTERRLFYAQAPVITGIYPTVPRQTRLLEPNGNAADEEDLVMAMFPNDTRPTASVVPDVLDSVRFLVQEKTAPNPQDSSGETELEYILGDIFHFDLITGGAPTRTEYFVSNLPAGSGLDCTSSKGYRCFFEKHRYRRKVLYAGANDGQLHAFDAGTFESQVVGGSQAGRFNVGTGQELFSYVPRELLETVVGGIESRSQHLFGVDGTARLDDVFIDPSHDVSAADPPAQNDREWRSVLIGGLREGGRSYYALDLTQPDPVTTEGGAKVPSAATYVPSCMSFTSYDATDCGPVPYGSTLWEFTDSDLGFTWSTPNTGRVQVVENGDVVEKFVAIFGGGIDPDDSAKGGYLYIVDLETGHALYKEPLTVVVGGATQSAGAAPSDPAAVDTDGNGLLDTIYIGTVGGYLFKVDLRTPAPLTAGVVDPTFTGWDPFAIFDTEGRPIFFPPSVFLVAEQGYFGLAFGTGWREDLWLSSRSEEEGRFYVVLDKDPGDSSAISATTTGIPFVEDRYVGIDAQNESIVNGNSLLSPTGSNLPGYVLELTAGEKLANRSFALSGILVFTAFVPDTTPDITENALCFFQGVTRVFTVFTTSGNGVGSGPEPERFTEVEGLVSNPFRASSGTSDPDSGCDPGDEDCEEPLSPTCPPDITEALKEFFPDTCRFTSATQDIQAVRSDTGLQCIAGVPVCVVERNWRDN
ncbi:MAG TPA: PilC/PilY family type IV pilus protein [Thermoanaerobaculia bacterium]|nr:PilC/PilY family type IV pilus protein [Thermoanaerobaculia bacterium]